MASWVFSFTRVLSLRVVDVTGTIFTEIPSYKLSELVADIGGSLGLILGIRNRKNLQKTTETSDF